MTISERVIRIRLQIAEVQIFKTLSVWSQNNEKSRFYLETEKELKKLHNKLAAKCQYPQL